MNKTTDKNPHIFRNHRGSTLVELLLALSIFSILVSVAISGFVQILSNQRLLLKLMAATDNASLTLEQMAREIRVSTNIESSLGGGPSIQFINPDGKIITYFLETSTASGRIFRKEESVPNDPNPAVRPVTADNVDVSYFNAEVPAISAAGPSRVVLNIGVRVAERKIKEINTYLQTVISSRAE
ncbi:MAG: hypothetical protein UV58_C0007G0023 [Candidatus Wolfebacteria bacterium GW2011_GWC1_43_10]|uniref:Prepilin-type N-terminal cleavage/methylation domain-containing protein n=1 Tax=Candidatus Wolfebacteria bacterium GW2011_GWC1_43_10 TaxID=1619011 RepID=A0A0G1CAW1_9BACT|nr:MAG: hypothetical protein UV58_C0007G0023 [Candidatus Wolfebacteria bacterium GW2011_GWC1_43_10]